MNTHWVIMSVRECIVNALLFNAFPLVSAALTLVTRDGDGEAAAYAFLGGWIIQVIGWLLIAVCMFVFEVR